MNETLRSNTPDAAPLAGVVQQAVAETGIDPAGVASTGEGLGGPAGAAGAAAVPSLVDPAVLEKTCVQFLRLVERAGQRSLYGQALRATGGDKDFAASVVAQWAWSESELSEVGTLVRATAEMYAVQNWLRPDVLLLVAAGSHAAGFFIASSAIRQRKTESDKLSAQTPPQTEDK